MERKRKPVEGIEVSPEEIANALALIEYLGADLYVRTLVYLVANPCGVAV
jgi:hypothetical protein